jgi:hypothetical protein
MDGWMDGWMDGCTGGLDATTPRGVTRGTDVDCIVYLHNGQMQQHVSTESC